MQSKKQNLTWKNLSRIYIKIVSLVFSLYYCDGIKFIFVKNNNTSKKLKLSTHKFCFKASVLIIKF